MTLLTCFKAYDVRGQLGDELNEAIAYRIGRAYAQHFTARRVVIGGDVRLSSASLKHALAEGLMDGGADVLDLGITGTEEVYFAAFYLDVDGGIEVTASHNPMDYNGMKFVSKGAQPVGPDSGLNAIQQLAEQQAFCTTEKKGTLTSISVLQPYIEHIIHYINPSQLKPTKLVVNAGNGTAGHVIDAIESYFHQHHIPIEMVKIHHEPDGTFPNGIPNPLLIENRAVTANAVIEHQAHMGIAWDGDFDRAFLFDEDGRFIEGYYIVGLLAEIFLRKSPKETVVHDPRLTWNTINTVTALGGQSVQSKTGHSFIKARMRETNAIYGGEMSAHHYFRDFAYCDSGMIPWLLVVEWISKTCKPLSQLVNEAMTAYPCSGEINYRVDNVQRTLERIEAYYQGQYQHKDTTDGLTLEFAQWRFNVRGSNTEPLLRLNIESRGNADSVQEHLQNIQALIQQECG